MGNTWGVAPRACPNPWGRPGGPPVGSVNDLRFLGTERVQTHVERSVSHGEFRYALNLGAEMINDW